jgi:hypothetical protein
MMELNVQLEFTCVECEQGVGVTVQCQGKELSRAVEEGLRVSVPCPSCGLTNRVVFEPTGLVRSVKACPSIRTFVEPSVN